MKTVRVWAMILLLLALPAMAGRETDAAKRTALIGHRGYSSRYTENTLTAFSGAYRNGFDGVELDVYETRSGALLVHHDASLKRLAGSGKKIWNLTEKSRKKYKLRKKYRIPTLEETFRVCAGYDGPILVHLKDAPKKGYRPKASCVRKIAALVKKYHLEDRVIVFDFKGNIGRFAGKYGLRYGVLTRADTCREISRLTKWAAARKIHMIMFVHMSSLKKDAAKKIRIIRKKGIASGVYFVNTKAQLKKLSRLKAEYAMSDYRLRKK